MPEILLISLTGLLALSLFSAFFIWRSTSRTIQDLSQKNQTLIQSAQDFVTQIAVAEGKIGSLENLNLSQADKLTSTSNQLVESQLEIGRLKTLLEEKTKQFNQQHEALKAEFKQLATEIFEQNNQTFSKQSSDNLSNVLTPLKNEVKAFKEQVEKNNQLERDQRVLISSELKNLQKQSQQLSDDAQQLSKSLQGQTKVQGNWGEMILERVLETSGLEAGRDFAREQDFKTVEGHRRPDVVVYLPGKRHLVIDAKTSLNAYNRFINSENDDERNAAIKEHVKALRDRMKELADKDYARLPGLVAPEVVVLFVPIEAAYVEAIKEEPGLLDEAMRMHLLIATPSTLLSAMQIVSQLWRFSEQSKHSKDLADKAASVYAKLAGFLTEMERLGKQIETSKATYDKALGQFYLGRGNLIKQAEEFKDLGVLVKKSIPDELIELSSREFAEELPPSLEDKSNEQVEAE